MSFQQALSGLNATSKSLDVIGNNIANANTYGSKVARAEFADVYAAALNGSGTSNVGIGTSVATVAQQFTQGSITTTGNSLDLAINGAGFFQVTDGSTPLYTRNGLFKLDRDGTIVNDQGLKLMGYPLNASGTVADAPGVLQLPTKGINAHATGVMTMEFNVDAEAKVPTADFSVDNSKSYANATTVSVYDSLGVESSLSYYFRKTGDNTWDVYAAVDGELVGDGSAWQSLTFDPTTGALATPDPATALDLTTPGGTIKVDLSQATQFAEDFGVTNMKQDGYTAGQLSSIGIEDDGTIMARYSNGQSKPAGQLALANFRNPQGLQPQGGNAWAASYASGDAIVGTPGSGNLGEIQSGALEESNIDLTGELVGMITAQRIYQANAQTIKTQDQVLQTLVNLR